MNCSLLLKCSLWLMSPVFSLLPLFSFSSDEGAYTYRITNHIAIITHYRPADNVAVSIPRSLGGRQVTEIGDSAFEDCEGVSSVTLPNGITRIGDSAFAGCNKLRDITLPSSLTTLGTNAFAGCDFRQITIPSNVVEMGYGIFTLCSELTNATFRSGSTAIGDGMFAGCVRLSSIHMPDSLTRIGAMAFFCCTNLHSLTLPGANMSIDKSAFLSPTQLHIRAEKAKIVWADSYGLGFIGAGPEVLFDVPNGTKSINEPTDASSLKVSITIPKTVSRIAPEALIGCQHVSVADENPYFACRDNVLFNKAGSKVIRANVAGQYVLPDTVACVDDWAFAACTDLKAILLPNSVTNIGDRAFNGCNSLTNVNIPENVRHIGKDAFLSCPHLDLTVAPANTSFCCRDGVIYSKDGRHLIYCPEWLGGSFTLPAEVTELGSSAFGMMTHLVVFSVDERNTVFCSSNGVLFSKDMRTLIRCPPGRSGTYEIPSGVTNIGYRAFAFCQGLSSVTLPESVTTISDSAFVFCTSLRTIKMPASVKSLGAQLFGYCINLHDVYFDGDEPAGIQNLLVYPDSPLKDPTKFNLTVHHRFDRRGWKTPFDGFKMLIWTQ